MGARAAVAVVSLTWGGLRGAHSAGTASDRACGRSFPELGSCTFERFLVSVRNFSRVPADCSALLLAVPGVHAAACCPGVLLMLLVRIYERLAHLGFLRMQGATPQTVLPFLVEIEHRYGEVVRLWPRAMTARWERQWLLQRWRDAVDDLYYDREGVLQILGASCMASLRQTVGRPGEGSWALEPYPRRRAQRELPGWLGSLEVHGGGVPMAHVEAPAVPAWATCGIATRSQLGQDLWVLHHFGNVEDGFWLEVGANHPEALSNTYLLETVAAWSGLSIEPFPRGDWRTRTRTELVVAAVGPDNDSLPFLLPGSVWGALERTADVDKIERLVSKERLLVSDVETRSLPSILRSARPRGMQVPRVIHYVSLDVEGAEYEVLRDFPFDLYLPLSFTVEHHHRAWRTQIHDLLFERGYVLDRNVDFDDYFLLRDYERYC